MSKEILAWRQRIDDARAEGLAAVFTKPKSGKEAVQRHLAIHLEYRRELEGSFTPKISLAAQKVEFA